MGHDVTRPRTPRTASTGPSPVFSSGPTMDGVRRRPVRGLNEARYPLSGGISMTGLRHAIGRHPLPGDHGHAPPAGQPQPRLRIDDVRVPHAADLDELLDVARSAETAAFASFRSAGLLTFGDRGDIDGPGVLARRRVAAGDVAGGGDQRPGDGRACPGAASSASSAAYPLAMPPRSSCMPGVSSRTVFAAGSSCDVLVPDLRLPPRRVRPCPATAASAGPAATTAPPARRSRRTPRRTPPTPRPPSTGPRTGRRSPSPARPTAGLGRGTHSRFSSLSFL